MGRRTLLLITSILIAAVGTALVAIYVRGADERAEEGTTLVSVLVATKKVNANDSLQAAIDGASFAPGRVLQRTVAADAVTSESQLRALSADGLVAAGPILPGQVVQKAMFTTGGAAVDNGLEAGKMRMAVQMADPNRSAGFIGTGSHVAVFATLGEGEDQQTFCVIPDVKVLAVGASPSEALQRTSATEGDSGGSAAEDPVPTTIVSLSVDQKQAQKLIFVSKAGELYFGVLGKDQAATTGLGATTSKNLTAP
jgi:pilus assembly protein CpaB